MLLRDSTIEIFRLDTPRRNGSQRALVRCLFGLIAVTCASAAGCTSKVIRANNLPPQYLAPDVTNALSLDLSGLAEIDSSTKLLRPGDVLAYQASTGIELETPAAISLPIADDGTVHVPLVGAVLVAGYDIKQAQQAIRDESIRRQIYVNPNVSVSLKERDTNTVTVMGEVDEPGPYELPVGSSDLLTALVAAGGLTEEADTIVEIRHPAARRSADKRDGSFDDKRPESRSARMQRVDLTQATSQGRKGEYRLDDGAKVMVMKKTLRSVFVMGLVNKPDQYKMPPDQDLRLLEAISMAGGRTISLADKIKVIRNLGNSDQPIVISASFGKAKSDPASNLRLAPGDVISVEETPTTFTVQTIRDFVRFGFSSGIPFF